MKQPTEIAGEGSPSNAEKKPKPPKRMLRASKSLDLTESPRRSERGEGSIIEAYHEARTRGARRSSIENSGSKYRGGSGVTGGVTISSGALENNSNADISHNESPKSTRRTSKVNSKIVVDPIQSAAIKRPSRMHRRMSAGPSYGYENNLVSRHRNLPGINQNRLPSEDSSSHIDQTDDGHDDESEYDSVVQSSIQSGASRYLSDPSIYGTPRRGHSDGSQSNSTSTIDSNFESPITQRFANRNLDRNSPANGSMSSIGMSPSTSSSHKPRTKNSPANNAGTKSSPSVLLLLKEESDRKLLTALNKMNTSNDLMTDDDDCSISSIRSAKLDDLKEMFSTSKRGSMKTKMRRKSNVIRSSSQGSLSLTGTPSSTKKVLGNRSIASNSNHSSSSGSSKSKNHDSASFAPTTQKRNDKKNNVSDLRDEDSDEDDDDTTVTSVHEDESVSECDTIEVLEDSVSFADASNPNLQMSALQMSATLSTLGIKEDTRRKRNSPVKDDTASKLDVASSSSDTDVRQQNGQSRQKQSFFDSTTSKLNMSAETLPMTNVVPVNDINDNTNTRKQRNNIKNSIKTDQIVESLVWFSFHIPRTVLEDLISHELELWRRQHIMKQNNSTRRRNEKKKDQQSRSSRRNVLKDGSSSHHTSKSQKSLTSQKSFASVESSADGDSELVFNDVDDDDNDNDSNSEGSVSSLSDEGVPSNDTVFDTNYAETVIRREGNLKSNDMIVLPKAVKRVSTILFVDMSGFTKLSTILDVESLSKVINSYFDMIVSEVISHGGDILKFAGDAFFAEWRVVEDDGNSTTSSNQKKKTRRRNLKKNSSSNNCNPLSDLNASLASINELSWDDHAIPPISMAVVYAAKCATSIVQKFSDYHVTTASGERNNGTATNHGDSGSSAAMLNVHCGIGVGHLVGLHVGDYKENEEEEATELRREFLIMGDPIDQVAKAADIAKCGEVMASPEAMLALAFCCDLTESQQIATEPVCIASRDESFLKYESFVVIDNSNALQPYESLRMHCKALNHTALARLNLQMALYVHPVIRGDELALSAAIQAGKISQPTETLESRHRAEAELRSVFTMFITPIISARITSDSEADEALYKKLGDIMHVTSRELDRYSGHLRQFIVDDKGVVLIATFGLRGSTFPNMVENNGLPAAFAIHRALKSEVGVDNRIGCTFGKVYCGVVGGVRRHEFAVMGAPVNLAARLMGSKVNNGILVDEAVREQCIGRYSFKHLPPVTAKGYDKPVPILEPIQMEAKASKKKKSSFPIIGRRTEKRTVLSVARGIIEEPSISQSTMIFLTGESGMGKTALAITILEELKKNFAEEKSIIVTARSTSTETEQRIPLRCEFDDGAEYVGRTSVGSSAATSRQSLKSMNSLSRRGRLLASAAAKATTAFGALAEESATEISVAESPVMDRSSRSLRRSVPVTGLSLTQHSKQKSQRYSLHVSNHGHLNRSNHGARKAETLSQSVHRVGFPEKNNRRESGKIPQQNLLKAQSMRIVQPKMYSRRSSKTFREDCEESAASLDTNFQKQGSSAQFFEKLCWACEQLDYPYEYADIVGSQFLGFESATPITHVDGHVPTIDELSEFLALAFIQITDHADLTTIFLDDFHWVDAFSWRIIRVLCKKAKKLILLSATRSHDKQALRRMSTAVAQESHLQSQMIEISLGPLDFSEIRELMSAVLDHKKSAIPDALCTDVFQRTGGLPVYVVQVLENIKRKKTLELVDGVLKWTAEGLVEKKNMASSKNGAVMEETFLSRFDALDVRVRKVLQTCAVLGLSFALSDVQKVHPEMEEYDIENALECAMDEMILVEQVEDDDDAEDDNSSAKSGSSRESAEDYESNKVRGDSEHHGSPGGERFFQFSHAMWRKNVLATMLKERKMELHRLIAEAMEKDEVLILEQSDISRLLTLFDHWKSCGEFCKVAPLALAVGSRLEEWDLAAQSLELYEDALEMAFDGVQPTEQETKEDDEWIQVKAKPIVLDLILRLHICMGMCHQRLGQDYQSILYFQDAYNIIKSASKMSGMSEALVMPIISSLCVLILEEEASGDPQAKTEHLKLVQTFVQEAYDDGDAVHIGRALALQALYLAKHGDFRGALETVKKLESSYEIEDNCEDMIAEYGRDFAMECMAESVQWLYLMGNHDEAENKADKVIKAYIPLLDPADTDQMMFVVLPIIQVFSLLDRASDADLLLKKYIINPYHDYESPSAAFWAPLFNPLAYLLEIIIMDDEDQHDAQVLEEMEDWVLDEENHIFEKELERKAHTIIGELCWRLALVKDDEDEAQILLLRKARELLEPVAFYPHYEIFQKQTAQALLDAL